MGQQGPRRVGCFQGIWSALGRAHNSLDSELARDRGESCFFVKYRSGMNYEAAWNLHLMQSQNRQLKKSYSYTQLGLGIAAFAALVSAIGIVINTALALFG